MATTDRSNATLKGTVWFALACSMGVAAAAPGAASNFTTLNSAVVTLSSHGGSPVSATAAYFGPSSDLPFWSSSTVVGTPVSYGTASWAVQEWFSPTHDNFGAYYENNTSSTFTIEMAWNVTFSRDVELRVNDLDGFGTVMFTPAGGSAATLNVGALLSAGTYDIVWNYSESTARTGVIQQFTFQSVATPVPGAGLAAAASLGLASLVRRRRR